MTPIVRKPAVAHQNQTNKQKNWNRFVSHPLEEVECQLTGNSILQRSIDSERRMRIRGKSKKGRNRNFSLSSRIKHSISLEILLKEIGLQNDFTLTTLGNGRHRKRSTSCKTTIQNKTNGEESKNTPNTTWIVDFFCQFQSIRIGQINVGRRHGQNQATRFVDIGEDHATDLLFNVGGLVTHRHFGQTG